MDIEYNVTPGKLVRGVTTFVIILFIGMTIGIPTMIYLADGMGWALFYTTGLMLAIYIPTLLLCWAYSPQQYIVSEKGITITRPIKPVFIPINTITHVEERDFNIFHLVKKGGNNGLFSITGNFSTKPDGTMWFCAKNNNFVMIHADKKSVLSPDDRFQFMNNLSNTIHRFGKEKTMDP